MDHLQEETHTDPPSAAGFSVRITKGDQCLDLPCSNLVKKSKK